MVSGIIGGEIGYRLLKALGRQDSGASTKVYSTKSKIDILLGEQFIDRIKGKTVIDFGCGFGDEAIEMATRGARKVIGLDIREEVLLSARQKAQQVGIDDRCVFPLRPMRQWTWSSLSMRSSILKNLLLSYRQCESY